MLFRTWKGSMRKKVSLCPEIFHNSLSGGVKGVYAEKDLYKIPKKGKVGGLAENFLYGPFYVSKKQVTLDFWYPTFSKFCIDPTR